MRVGNHPKDDFSERDILYKVLFDMKRDMVELKKLVADIIEHGGGVTPGYSVNSQTVNQLYRDIEMPGNNPDGQFTIQQPVISNNVPFNITHEAEEVEESLSLIEKGNRT